MLSKLTDPQMQNLVHLVPRNYDEINDEINDAKQKMRKRRFH